MAKKILEKIQKKLDRLDALHEKEEVIIDRIGFMIDEDSDNETLDY